MALGRRRHILVDYARARKMAKRGGVAHRVSLDEGLTIGPERGDDLVALDDALTLLAGLDQRRSQIVELRFFGGMTEEEDRRTIESFNARDAQQLALGPVVAPVGIGSREA